jgi:hypothetical protein
MNRLIAVASVAATLTGCAMSTGILPAGPDTYTVSEHFAPIRGGSTTAQQTALTEANAFCAGQGRQFLPVDMLTPSSANPYGTTGYSVTFRCLRFFRTRIGASGHSGPKIVVTVVSSERAHETLLVFVAR